MTTTTTKNPLRGISQGPDADRELRSDPGSLTPSPSPATKPEGGSFLPRAEARRDPEPAPNRRVTQSSR